MCVATSTAVGIGIAAGTAGAGIYAAHKTAGAAEDAAKLQTDAANHAADVEGQSTAEALAFQRQQAQYQAQQDEINRRANYDQWAAKQRKVGSIGQMLGLGGVEVPDYVPGATPNFNAPTSVGAGQTPAAAAAAPPSSIGAMVDNPYGRSRVMPGLPAAAPLPFAATSAGGAPMPGPMSAPAQLPPNPTPGNFGPYANDFTPRDPRTGAILRPRLLSIGDYTA